MKDMLGVDGSELLGKVVKTHKKSMRRDEDKLNRILNASKYFDEKMKICTCALRKRMDTSQVRRFEPSDYPWREDYKKIMTMNRQRNKY